jgi:hypothetical protein
MRLSMHRPIAFTALLAVAALAAAQGPPPPPNGGANPPPPKQNPPPGGDRRNPSRPRAAGTPLPMMNGAEMPELAPTTEEPVTSSGNVDLWRARIAERRAKQEQATASGGASPR